MTTMTLLLAQTLADLEIDPTTPSGKLAAAKLALRLGMAADLGRAQAMDQSVRLCVEQAEKYEAESTAQPKFRALKGQRLTERATGAHYCASLLRRWRAGNDVGKST